MRHDALGIYISIPFCRSKCTYCNFASGVYPASEHQRYINRLVQDIAASRSWAARYNLHVPRTVDTIYLGGGTPSLLAPQLIRQLFDALRSEFVFDSDAEITVECAPGQIASDTLDALASVGVNRVSLGVQSFIDQEAHSSGRLHSRAIVLEDLRRLRAAGISNLNLDLIAGLAGQTFASWDESLGVLLDTGVPHASIYMLEVDEDSRLGREMLSGGARYHAGLVPSDDAIAGMYVTAVGRLAAAGIAQYEISNFSRPGAESRHNLRYWQRRPYFGFGVDASSALYEADAEGPAEQGSATPTHPPLLRFTATDELGAFLDATESPETAWLSVDRQLEEAWFLGLRLNAGVDLAALTAEFGSESVSSSREVVQRLQAEGLLWSSGERVGLTPQGRLLSNDVFQQFLELTAVP